MTVPGYSRGDLHHLRALLRRAAHLAARLGAHAGAPDPAASYDRLELAGLRWAIDRITAATGPLPPDLAELRDAVWPSLPTTAPTA